MLGENSVIEQKINYSYTTTVLPVCVFIMLVCTHMVHLLIHRNKNGCDDDKMKTSDEAILTNTQLKITNEGILKTSGNAELQKIIAAKI